MTRSMDNNEFTTDVLIGGKVYSLKGADSEYLQKVAALLNQKLAEVKSMSGYKNLDSEYKALLMNLNLADEFFKAADEAARYRQLTEQKENELYAAKHELVSLKLKLENSIKQQDILEKRVEQLKEKCEELKDRYEV